MYTPENRLYPRTPALRAGMIALLTSATLAIVACEKSTNGLVAIDPHAPASGTAAAPQGSARTNEQATAKLNAYTAAYNKLVGSAGLVETRDSYVKSNIPAKRITDAVSFTDGQVEEGLVEMRQGRLLPTAGLDALDNSADELIAPLDKLVTQLKALSMYYTAKAYKQDSFAKGKSLDPEIRALFNASVVALKTFNSALGAEQKKRDVAALASLKETGDLLGYHTQLALQQAEELVAVFADSTDISAAGAYQQADVVAASLEKTLVDQRQQYVSRKPKPANGYESVHNKLVALIASYRKMKQSKKQRDYDNMVTNYNSAVETVNQISR